MSTSQNFIFCLPEGITAKDFLQEYWQKKPLLIRNGLPQIKEMFNPKDILELALQDGAITRLVSLIQDKEGKDNYNVKAGPLDASDFINLPEKWSVLVQNLEQWSTELGNLWKCFEFLPQWQRDDIMVSYSPKNSSVGRHYDEYDVFLVQGYGHRRWQLGKWCTPETEFVPEQPLRLCSDMGDLIFDEVLAPGDVLYVPSRLSHYGVSEGDCLTFSYGFRFPNVTSLLQNIEAETGNAIQKVKTKQIDIPLRLTPSVQGAGEIDEDMIRTMKERVLDYLINSDEFDQLFKWSVVKTVSQRRYDSILEENDYYPDELYDDLNRGLSLMQDANCRIVYLKDPLFIYIDGIWLDELSNVEAELLRGFSNGKIFNINDFHDRIKASDDPLAKELLLDSLCNWLENGWLILEEL